jgi:RNA polymerase II-associated factor 1
LFSIRFVRYKPTSLEKNYRWDLLTEHDVGVEIDLINPDAYASNGRNYYFS